MPNNMPNPLKLKVNRDATPPQEQYKLADQPGTSARHARQPPSCPTTTNLLKGRAAAAAGEQLLCRATDQVLQHHIDNTRDPILRHLCFIKHSNSSLGSLLPRLGLQQQQQLQQQGEGCSSNNSSSRGRSLLGCSQLVQGFLSLLLQLMGWPGHPSTAGGGAWELLASRLMQEEQQQQQQQCCWLPTKTAINKLAAAGIRQQSKLKPNRSSSSSSNRGYIQLHTLKWGEGTAAKSRRTLYAHQIMCWAVHGSPPVAADSEDDSGEQGPNSSSNNNNSNSCWVVRHLCGRPGCIRPGCLVWGTHKQNAQDRASHRDKARLKGVCSMYRQQ